MVSFSNNYSTNESPQASQAAGFSGRVIKALARRTKPAPQEDNLMGKKSDNRDKRSRECLKVLADTLNKLIKKKGTKQQEREYLKESQNIVILFSNSMISVKDMEKKTEELVRYWTNKLGK